MNPNSLIPVVRALAIAGAVLAVTPAQGALTEVPPGRELSQEKLLSPNLTDVWKVEAAAGEEFWCTVETMSFDPVLECFDADGKRLGSDDGEGLRSRLILRAEHAGPLEFRVAGFRSSGGGPYHFMLTRRGTEVLAPNGEGSHRFGPERWWHWRVPMARGDILVPTVRGDGQLLPVFDDLRLPLQSWLGGYEAPRDGELLIGVEGPEDHTCQLTLRLARRRTLGADGSIAAEVERDGLDLLCVPLHQGMAGAISLACEQGPPPCELRERSGPLQPRFLNWNGQLDKGGMLRRWFFCRQDTELLVAMRGNSERPLPYRGRLDLGCNEFGVAAPAHGTLAHGNGDLHRLDLVAGQLVRVRLHSDAFDGRFDLWDPSGNVIARPDDRAPLDRDAEVTLLAAQSGTFRVLAHSDGRGAGAYELGAEILPVPQLRIGEALPVQLERDGTSYAHIDLQKGQEVWFAVRSREFDAGITVQDATGRTTLTSEGGGIGNDVLTAYVAENGGPHTVLVHARSAKGKGELRVVAP